jgi:hypothetical protein
MGQLSVSATTVIEMPAAIVRQQFSDVEHHDLNRVHRGVRFEIIEDGVDQCRYLQVTRVGPVALRQELTLHRTPDGPLVNTVERGQFAGGSISFDIEPTGPEQCTVRATVVGAVPRWQVPAQPLMRRMIERNLAIALAEDKADIESGGYQPADGAPLPSAVAAADDER